MAEKKNQPMDLAPVQAAELVFYPQRSEVALLQGAARNLTALTVSCSLCNRFVERILESWLEIKIQKAGFCIVVCDSCAAKHCPAIWQAGLTLLTKAPRNDYLPFGGRDSALPILRPHGRT